MKYLIKEMGEFVYLISGPPVHDTLIPNLSSVASLNINVHPYWSVKCNAAYD